MFKSPFTTLRRTLRVLALVTSSCLVAHGASAQILESPPLFNSKLFSYQTLRAFNHIQAGGGDSAEIFNTVKAIKNNDVESWYQAWRGLANREALLGLSVQDKRSKGLAYLRAHNYYRTAEFVLPPKDARRTDTSRRAHAHFYLGLDTLGVPYQRLAVPYDNGAHLNAVYFPPTVNTNKPLLVIVGGFDSTMEELYFLRARAAIDRGYPVLIYEGPGQGEVLKQQGLTFIYNWEKVNSAVLDAFLRTYPRPAKIVLLGLSFGGYLAPRAAAFDSRIDGLIVHGAFFDGKAVAADGWPSSLVQLMDSGRYDTTLDKIVEAAAALDVNLRWRLENGKWTMGQTASSGVFREFSKYMLAPVAGRIRQPVLLTHGTKDHLVPFSQAVAFRDSLVNARSVTTKWYDQSLGGQEHVQMGASTLWEADTFDWLEQQF